MSTQSQESASKTDHASGQLSAQSIRDACQLLYFAAERGRSIAPEIRGPLLAACARLRAGGALASEDEGGFLDAYARLAALMNPVTAVTLRASDKRFGERRLARAQFVSLGACIFTLSVLLLLATGESFRAGVVDIADAQRTLDQTQADLLAFGIRMDAKDPKQPPLAHEENATAQTTEDRQVTASDEKGASLKARWTALNAKITKEYGFLYERLSYHDVAGTYHSLLEYFTIPDAVAFIGSILGGFLLPLLYGALGTSVYILRSMYAKMIERSFDPSDVGEFVVRVFLGTLCGVTVPWLFLNGGKQLPGGLTPSLLAFLAGYSVELLFTLIDRLLVTAKELLQPAPATNGATASTVAATKVATT